MRTDEAALLQPLTAGWDEEASERNGNGWRQQPDMAWVSQLRGVSGSLKSDAGKQDRQAAGRSIL